MSPNENRAQSSTPLVASGPSSRRDLGLVLALSAASFALRALLILALPDLDTDAYGHFRIARSMLSNATNLDAHWVWLPGYHFFLYGLLKLGLAFRGARLASALVASVSPWVLWELARKVPGEPLKVERAALFAASLLAIAPVTTRMATSAQGESFFTLLLLAVPLLLERERGVLAGLVLAAACLTRYEAWGATVALALLAARDRRAPALFAAALGLASIACWIAVRAAHDGALFVALRSTQEFSTGMSAMHFGGPLLGSRILDWLIYALGFPILALGPPALLVYAGVLKPFRAFDAIALGALGFVLVSYAAGGSPRAVRYFCALVPFACLAIARALELRFAARRALATKLVVGLVAATTVAHLAWLVHRGRELSSDLREREANANAYE